MTGNTDNSNTPAGLKVVNLVAPSPEKLEVAIDLAKQLVEFFSTTCETWPLITSDAQMADRAGIMKVTSAQMETLLRSDGRTHGVSSTPTGVFLSLVPDPLAAAKMFVVVPVTRPHEPDSPPKWLWKAAAAGVGVGLIDYQITHEYAGTAADVFDAFRQIWEKVIVAKEPASIDGPAEGEKPQEAEPAPPVSDVLLRKDFVDWVLEEALGSSVFRDERTFGAAFGDYVGAMGAQRPGEISYDMSSRLPDQYAVKFTVTVDGRPTYEVDFNHRLNRVTNTQLMVSR